MVLAYNPRNNFQSSEVIGSKKGGGGIQFQIMYRLESEADNCAAARRH